MVKTTMDADLVRLRQLLKALEADARITPGDIDLSRHEIEILKLEIAHLEGVLNGHPDYGSRAFLFQIAIDYGTSQCAR